MAAVTHGVTTASTVNGTSYASGAFTPAANDLLVVFVVGVATVAAGSVTDNQSGTYTKIDSQVSGANTNYVFVRDSLTTNVSHTVTFDCTGDAAAGTVIFVARVSGMSRVGSNASRQIAKSTGGAASTPAVTFGSACLTENPTLGCVGNSSNPAGLTPPTNWTERGDTGFGTPTSGGEYVSRDSGFTGTTITWGGVSVSAHYEIAIELDSSAASSRAAEVSWAEVEVPNAPRKAEISWVEMEVPTPSRAAEVSWVEFEIPTGPRLAEVSWAELEVPDPSGGGGGSPGKLHFVGRRGPGPRVRSL